MQSQVNRVGQVSEFRSVHQTERAGKVLNCSAAEGKVTMTNVGGATIKCAANHRQLQNDGHNPRVWKSCGGEGRSLLRTAVDGGIRLVKEVSLLYDTK